MPSSGQTTNGHRVIDIVIPATKIKPFWKKVAKNRSPTDCWLWKDRPGAGGVGYFRIDRESRAPAHKVAWVLEKRTMFCSWHLLKKTCGNKMCVNPAHHYKNERDLRHPSIGKRKQSAYVIHPPGDTQIWTVSPPEDEEDTPHTARHVISGEELLKEIQGVRVGISDLASGITRLLSSQGSRLQGVENIGSRVEEINKTVQALHGLQPAINRMVVIEKEIAVVRAQASKVERVSEDLQRLVLQQEKQVEALQELKNLISGLGKQSSAPPPPPTPELPVMNPVMPATPAPPQKTARAPFLTSLAGMFTEAFSCNLESEEDWENFAAAFEIIRVMGSDPLEKFVEYVQLYADRIEQRGETASTAGFLNLVQESVTSFRT